MKTFRYLTIAVLALVMAACSSDRLPEQNAASHQGKGIPFTSTISMRSSATRSVMTENSDNTISAAWKTDDELALVYEVSGQKQVTKATMTVLDDKSATIKATIAEGVTAGTKVSLLYPYAAVCNDAEKAAYGAMKEDALMGQDGTLETIAEKYDLCQGDGEFTLSSSGTASLKADVTMASRIAIWKLSLTDGTNALKTEQINVFKDSDEDNMFACAILEKGAAATNIFYIAVPAISNARIDIQTNIDGNTYNYSKEGVTLEAGKYYQSPLVMSLPVPEKQAGSISYATKTVEKETTDGNFTNKLTVVGDGKVTYSSDKESVATVNQNGQVTIKGAGEATITATVEDSDTYTYAVKTATYKLKVSGGLTDYNVKTETDW